jgi:hypothetical protein
MKTELKKRSLQSLADARLANELRPKPEYQRGTVWKLPQKQGLIDSLLRGYQIPLFYVHLEERPNNYTGQIETTAWIVDGQQRLDAIIGYRQNEFSLPDPKKAKPGSVLPPGTTALPPWNGKKFEELSPEEKERLLGRELLVIEMTADHPNEVRDLFIRLQAGTPLTAQEKRDAWPGEFTNFVIRHAGKPGHSLSNPKRFFNLFPRSRGLTVDDGIHYVDGLAETRKFFAGLAMTIMVRERAEVDFVDLKGATINDFYLENLVLEEGDPGALRVLRVLDLVAQLPGFENLREGRPLSFQWAFHLALLVDSLNEGRYSPVWRQDVVGVFLAFKQEVANAQLQYRETRESRPHYERFGRLLSGSGSDTADVIRLRHSFLLAEVYGKIRLIPLDPQRLFDPLEKEVIWNRDRGLCQNPSCQRPERKVPFRDATVHHVIEHTAGGNTTLQNGVLICPDCHSDRGAMQRLASHFQDYLRRIYASPALQTASAVAGESRGGTAVGQPEPDGDAGENHLPAAAGGLKIVVDWGALDVDREPQTISGGPASDLIAKLLVELISAFGKPMEEQLTELPVIRFPLSRTPSTAFVNGATGRPFSSLPVPGTDLHFCPHSSTPEKVTRLTTLFSRLVLPDGRGFPEGSIHCSFEAEPP